MHQYTGCLEISVNRHNSKLVAIAGHHDCAGNPIDKETQLEQIHTAMKTVESWILRFESLDCRSMGIGKFLK
ncbi:carbonic anhydrase [Chloroflexota bacterium]